jgi:hypothetical protein
MTMSKPTHCPWCNGITTDFTPDDERCTCVGFRDWPYTDKRLSRTFERWRDNDLLLCRALANAIWHDAHDQDLYLIITELGDTWTVATDRGSDPEILLDEGHLNLRIPTPPWRSTTLLKPEDIKTMDPDTIYNECLRSMEDHLPIEYDLCKRFYRCLYRNEHYT